MTAAADQDALSFTGSYELVYELDYELDYELAGSEYAGERHVEIEYQPEGFYTFTSHTGMPDLSWEAKGLEAFGFLGIMGGVDMPLVAVYQKQGDGLSGLATSYKYEGVLAETTSRAKPLTLSDIDFTGTYELTGNIGACIDSTESYEPVRDMVLPKIQPFVYKVCIERSGQLWDIEYTSYASQTGHGVGIAVADVLVVGFVDDTVDTEIWILKKDEGTGKFEGRWLYCFKDRQDKQIELNGCLKAQKQED
ncbi:MAG: hypothetical protein JW724_08260 [Candidatus Altiarchaeota archaeon]|nr:hypothetical protein [Candidatus Altiarchaeota archaeon]